MKPDCKPGPLREKCRQAFVHVRVDQAIGPPLADAHQIGQRNRGVIESQGKRSAVKISAGDNVAAFRKDERIIGRRPRFNRENLVAVRESTANRSMDLRHAADAVGVLHARIVLAVRFANLTFAQQTTTDVSPPPSGPDADARPAYARQTPSAFL